MRPLKIGRYWYWAWKGWVLAEQCYDETHDDYYYVPFRFARRSDARALRHITRPVPGFSRKPHWMPAAGRT